MNPSIIFQFLPYAARLAKAAATIERLEKDPDVQDVLDLVKELGPLIAKAQQQDATGIQGGQ